MSWENSERVDMRGVGVGQGGTEKRRVRGNFDWDANKQTNIVCLIFFESSYITFLMSCSS